MVADTLKSASITNLDASPIVANTQGNGASMFTKSVQDFVTPTTGGLASTSSIYKMVRLPTSAKLQGIWLSASGALDTNGAPTLAVDVGAYYSDSTTDGTQAALQGTLISANCFAAVLVFGAATNRSFVYAMAALSVEKQQQLLWQALGLSKDPGGFIDIVIAVHTVAATPASQNLSLQAEVAL